MQWTKANINLGKMCPIKERENRQHCSYSGPM